MARSATCPVRRTRQWRGPPHRLAALPITVVSRTISSATESGAAMGQSIQAKGKAGVPKASAAQEAQQYLTFLLGGEMYAVGILNVKEIIAYGQITEIPMMPAFIRGGT